MLKQMCGIAREAGALILSARDRDKRVEEKSFAFDLVTRYDRAVQELVETRLHALLPEATFMGEEDVPAPDGENNSLKFIIDPIDGTTNFIKELHMSCISIALSQNGQVTHGVIYDPYADELFSAQLGKGAWLGDRRLQVSGEKNSRPVTIMGMSPYDRKQFEEGTFQLMRDLFHTSVDVRITGSAALDFCYMAAGRAEMFAEFRQRPWDCAAGSLIASEAGCRVTDLRGEPLQFEKNTSVLVAGEAWYPALYEIAAPYARYLKEDER